jgi:N-acetylglucosamine-6-phosphate deacetylase
MATSISGQDACMVAGRLVFEDRVAAGRLSLEGGRIVHIELDPAEATGPYVCPGFVDVHCHGWGGYDAMGKTDDLDGMARALLRNGVTAFLPTAVTAPLATLVEFAERVRRWLPSAPPDGAGPLGYNLEGPYISPAKKGAQNPAYIQVAGEVEPAALEPLVEGLRIMTLAPETPGALDLIRLLSARGVVVSLGHSAATYEEALAGYRAGARSTTHLFNAMSGVDHHHPGLAVAALSKDDAYVELIADGFHVHRSLWPIIVRVKGPDRLVLVSDAIAVAGTGDGLSSLGGLEVEVRDGQCRLVDGGALAGSVIALDSAVRNLVDAGVPLPWAVAAASCNPLALIGVADRGRLAPGQQADLVELDDALQVRGVIRAGHRIELS